MKVVYSEEMSVATIVSMSPSAGKPRLFVEHLLETDEDVEIVRPEPVTMSDLFRAHDSKYVEGVLNGAVRNGFGNNSMEIARSLRHTSGSMLTAARLALGGAHIVCSPTSGFHHAGYDFGGGFCTFNGLMVALMALREEGLVQRAAIVDCDVHYGNGTEDIANRLKCREWLTTTGDSLQRESGRAYLLALECMLNRIVRFKPDIVLYQAGADAHEGDPQGGVLSTREMKERDEMVFNMLSQTPIAWNLAGGYQELPVILGLHISTFKIGREFRRLR